MGIPKISLGSWKDFLWKIWTFSFIGFCNSIGRVFATNETAKIFNLIFSAADEQNWTTNLHRTRQCFYFLKSLTKFLVGVKMLIPKIGTG